MKCNTSTQETTPVRPLRLSPFEATSSIGFPQSPFIHDSLRNSSTVRISLTVTRGSAVGIAVKSKSGVTRTMQLCKGKSTLFVIPSRGRR